MMPEGTCRALLIGNSTFPDDPHTLPDLNGPVNDLPLLRDALTDPEVGLFEAGNVRLLPERSKRDITTAMEKFFQAAGPDDQLFLYYSGHGMKDLKDNLYLCARDTQTNLLVSTGISDVEINGMMTQSSARTFVIMLDCCYSGAFKSGGLPTNLRGEGRFLVTSSRRAQSSIDNPDESGPSAFTRHLVEGMRLGNLDSNGDGYVSLNELYDYVLDRLQAETKQIPQRHFANTVGDIALARSKAATTEPIPPVVVPAVAFDQDPALDVSETEIEIRDVQPDEALSPEVVDVFNRGGGMLDWVAESDAAWIEVASEETFVRLVLKPQPGVNRGKVRVRDRGRGGSRTIRVTVTVKERTQEPVLDLTDRQLDFGTLSLRSQSPRMTVQLRNVGGGALDARAEPNASWIDIHRFGDALAVMVDTSAPGDLEGEIKVLSRGGEDVISVRARVEPGPVLALVPKIVDFGRLWDDQQADQHVSVRNEGQAALEWSFDQRGDFFTVDRAGDGLAVRLTSTPGVHLGSIWVRSNGGEASIDVKADVVPRPAPELVPTTLPHVQRLVSPAPARKSHGVRNLVLAMILGAVVIVGLSIWAGIAAQDEGVDDVVVEIGNFDEGFQEGFGAGCNGLDFALFTPTGDQDWDAGTQEGWLQGLNNFNQFGGC